MKLQNQIIVFALILLVSCTGSKKYFKAAEKLERQGLVNEAAEYYLESLQRKPTNVEARIKLKDVGQKYASNLSSDFFRTYNTNQLEASLSAYERLKDFTSKTAALNVLLDYPQQYDEDYAKAVESYLSKNHQLAYNMVNEKKYNNALSYIKNIKKYNSAYKTTQQLETIAICEPLYQNAVASLENKNCAGAFNILSSIKGKTENYKDSKDLYELSALAQAKHFILFEPKNSSDKVEKEIEDYLFSSFNQLAISKFQNAKVINNTPFTYLPNVSEGGAYSVDMIQAIRKATGADYFYQFDVSNKKETNSGPMKTSGKAFQEIKTKKDTIIITEYKVVDYNVVKANRSYSYNYQAKLINAYNNQIVSSQNQIVSGSDAVEYNEFTKTYNGDINKLFPYNPQVTPPAARYNPSNWRKGFTANKNLKSFDQLKDEANNKAISLFGSSVENNMK